MKTAKRVIQKVLATLTTVAILMPQFAFIGLASTTYAVNPAEINNENIEFKAYFDGDSIETTKGVNETAELHLDIKVKADGYLSDAKIEFGKSANFIISNSAESEFVKKIEEQAIYLNQINEGDEVSIDVEIKCKQVESISMDYLSCQTPITLTGKYINSSNVGQNGQQITGNANVKVNWKSKATEEANISIGVITDATYLVNNENKKIVQLLLESNIKDNNYPVKDSLIEVTIPSNPESVKIHKRTTDATNGDREFNQDSYEYSSGKITINLHNGQDNLISWKKDAEDSIIITLQYPEETDTDKLEFTAKSKLTLYDKKEIEGEDSFAIGDVHIDEEEQNSAITGSYIIRKEKITKGKFYGKQEIDYTVPTTVYVDYAKGAKDLQIVIEGASITKPEGKGSISTGVNTEILKTVLNKSELINIFGEDFSIIAKDQDGATIFNITNATEADENGNITINYSEGTDKVIFTISNPKTEGQFTYYTTKKILDTEIETSYIKDADSILDGDEIIYKKDDLQNTEITAGSTYEIELQDTSSEAKLIVEPNTLSTAKEDQEINLKVILKSDLQKDLYKNPKIEITMPEQITSVATQAKLLYGNGLILNEEDFSVKTENGKIKIIANITGEQTSYPTESVEGTTLAIRAIVNVNNNSESSEQEIVLNYTNQNASTYIDGGVQKQKINIVKQTKQEPTEGEENPTEKTNVPKIDISLEASNGNAGYIKPGDKITYTITIKNSGDQDTQYLEVEDMFSDYLDLLRITINDKECEYEEIPEFDEIYNSLLIKTTLKAGETKKITINAQVNKHIYTDEVLRVINKAYAYEEEFTAESNEHTSYIQADSNTTYGDSLIIAGTVWLDTKQDGYRDSEEELLEGIKVYAINITNNEIAKDEKGIEISATTDEDGFYMLANIPKGEYIIAFEYDTEKYMPTAYQAEGISEELNSDAVTATRIIDGSQKTLAFTDIIKLTKNEPSIDLGLAERKTFDLELEKVVSKVIVTNNSGTKEYNFEDTNLAKVEIKSKYLSGSNVLVEYKINVKNVGEIPGYAKTIVDYMPSTLKFSSSVNNGWYQKNGYIYNDELSDTLIEPGETKEISLILTKTMTASNTGLTNNKAEMIEVYNTRGVEEQNLKNNLSSADLIIMPSTGEKVSQVVLIIVTVITICGLTFFIYKTIKRRNNIKV